MLSTPMKFEINKNENFLQIPKKHAVVKTATSGAAEFRAKIVKLMAK